MYIGNKIVLKINRWRTSREPWKSYSMICLNLLRRWYSDPKNLKESYTNRRLNRSCAISLLQTSTFPLVINPNGILHSSLNQRVLADLRETNTEFSDQIDKIDIRIPRAPLSLLYFKGEEHDAVEIVTQWSQVTLSYYLATVIIALEENPAMNDKTSDGNHLHSLTDWIS